MTLLLRRGPEHKQQGKRENYADETHVKTCVYNRSKHACIKSKQESGQHAKNSRENNMRTKGRQHAREKNAFAKEGRQHVAKNKTEKDNTRAKEGRQHVCR